MEIDHVFLRTKRGAPEAALLLELGFTEGTCNKHPGQGTANRRFFFHNAFIELLWIDDENEIRAEAARPTMLYERLNHDGFKASPFGLCFRPVDGQERAPFPTWTYAPAYVPQGMVIDIAEDVPLSEPMWFFLKQASAPVSAAEGRRQALTHRCGVREITSIAVTTSATGEWSKPATAAASLGCVTLAQSDHHLIEITFDCGYRHQRHDFRPILPLIVNY